jgi:hypothetical protein
MRNGADRQVLCSRTEAPSRWVARPPPRDVTNPSDREIQSGNRPCLRGLFPADLEPALDELGWPIAVTGSRAGW